MTQLLDKVALCMRPSAHEHLAANLPHHRHRDTSAALLPLQARHADNDWRKIQAEWRAAAVAHVGPSVSCISASTLQRMISRMPCRRPPPSLGLRCCRISAHAPSAIRRLATWMNSRHSADEVKRRVPALEHQLSTSASAVSTPFAARGPRLSRQQTEHLLA